MTALLSVENLHVEFATYGGIVKAVRGVSFDVEAGQTLAIVGESGSGKSVTMQAVMGLIPMPPGRITQGSAKLRGQDFLGRLEMDGRTICGDEIGMIFQDPMSSLNPTMRIGDQIAETLKVHRDYSVKEAWKRAVELLELVKIPEASKRAAQYPFEFSGGMLQRVMIAMAVACKPAVLIADEPTTALDVTIQAQILDLLQDIQKETGMAIILITHDLAVVARMADKVAVMYAGQIVEAATVNELFYESAHPYTLGLKQAMPSAESDENHVLEPIPGSPPDLFSPPQGCAYCARCPWHMQVCQTDDPASFRLSDTHTSRCWLQHPRQPREVEGLHRAANQSTTKPASDAAGQEMSP
ncbi:ABC transporter ATP-binding protein [Pseudohongiella nitratireducens]|uniref:ABC transporter ATP-binding protein n=1 Tax=Pseudohongiella nitratireducens TaxID=1768907 RepID=UPI0024093170|nr:ABC transporter ATP-binding protein [Pseudohongiella nitratireducens]MDF1623232.1 ABC transporter ATP-binding protein [Pseudohongiella nitratireducens]